MTYSIFFQKFKDYTEDDFADILEKYQSGFELNFEIEKILHSIVPGHENPYTSNSNWKEKIMEPSFDEFNSKVQSDLQVLESKIKKKNKTLDYIGEKKDFPKERRCIYLGNISQVQDFLSCLNELKYLFHNSFVGKSKIKFTHSSGFNEFMGNLTNLTNQTDGVKMTPIPQQIHPDMDTEVEFVIDYLTILPYKFEGIINNLPNEYSDDLYLTDNKPSAQIPGWEKSSVIRRIPPLDCHMISVNTMENIIMSLITYYEEPIAFKKLVNKLEEGPTPENEDVVYDMCIPRDQFTDFPCFMFVPVSMMYACRMVKKYDVMARIVC